MRARLWYIPVYFDTLFWAMNFVVYGECFGPWRYCVLVYGILRLLQVGTCWAKNWSLVTRNPGEMYCRNDQGHGVCDQDLGQEYGPFRVLKFLQGIMEGPLCWENKRCIRIVPWWTHVKMANHANIVKQNLDNN